MFVKTELKTLGMMSVTVRHPLTQAVHQLDFYVIQREDPILGIDACQRLELLRIVEENICAVHDATTPACTSPTPPPPPSRPTPAPRRRPSLTVPPQTVSPSRQVRVDDSFAREQYADVFDGIGLLEGEVHFQTDSSLPPVQMPLRRLPVAIREKVATELRNLVQDGIIEPVSEPTPWVSALLVATKPDGSLRICIDPRKLNKALCRATYLMPTIDDVLTQLTGAKVYSTADLKHGYWHCLLDPESSLLTAFETPLGRFIWRRLPFGINIAPEVFQAKVHQALEGLRGVFCVAEDLLIAGFGDTKEEADKDHDRNLLALLQRCREKGIKLNSKKFRLRRQVRRLWAMN